MKTVIISAAAAAAMAALAGPVLAKPGPEVEIRHAVARVAVVVEDRSDVAVEVEQGAWACRPFRSRGKTAGSSSTGACAVAAA